MTCEGGPQVLHRRTVNSAAAGWLVLLVRILCVLILAGFGLGAYFRLKAMKRAYRYNAHVVLQKARQRYVTYGVITNPHPAVADVFPFTNHFRVQNTNYECVLGMWWGHKAAQNS
ncbi:MAG: hypothetical protein RMN51_09130 [Verrucomicrobiota bacterium]|nr:hypothetical protein [Limisphaera sp.]MDW8382253.1 hypothetical protein [Verrucomicrobiota bacterium]